MQLQHVTSYITKRDNINGIKALTGKIFGKYAKIYVVIEPPLVSNMHTGNSNVLLTRAHFLWQLACLFKWIRDAEYR